MSTIPLGFEVGTGAVVEIPLAHTFVTGQTQLSGKTTTLRAIVERSGQRALAFVTKRGEAFEGRRVPPYLPREGTAPIHWRLVETILASALGERKLKYERLWIINAAKGAKSLQHVRDNVEHLLARTKGNSRSVDAYILIREYLDLVLPEMRALAATDTLDLQPGLNVMDLTGVGLQLQALVIRAALEHINGHEEGVLTVFPEAWEFAPRGRTAPAKDEAIAMIRKGAVLRNFLLCDSQDIAGVDTVVRQGASVWILGVQRELNEVKRTLQMITAGIKRPKPEDVAQLELGQFYACFGRHAIKTYVQPTWLSADDARSVSMGGLRPETVQREKQHNDLLQAAQIVKEDSVTKDDAARLTRENEQLKANIQKLLDRIDVLERKGRHDHAPSSQASTAHRPGTDAGRTPARVADRRRDVSSGDSATAPPADAPRDGAFGRTQLAPIFPGEGTFDVDALYQAIKARLIDEAPAILQVMVGRPELAIHITRATITVDGDTLRGRIARLITEDFFSKARTSAEVLSELERRGDKPSNIELGNELKALMKLGFFTRDNKWLSLVPDMVVNVVES